MGHNFRHLGYSRNPFGALTAVEWEAVAVPPLALLTLAERGFRALQVIAEKGRGKTTALRWLAAWARADGLSVAYERIPEEAHSFRTRLDALGLFCLDEAQRLDLPGWLNLLGAARNGLRLALGTHASHEWTFRLFGVPVETLRLEEIASREHLRAVLDRRLEVFALGGSTPRAWIDPAAVDWLAARHGADLRAIEWALYEAFQQAEGPICVDASAAQRACRWMQQDGIT
ncbi:MAG: hypothetical protein IT326_01245 [Anaerolineae bacterium]|nr:hypothetical protein [Anaerolineae bacterium]